MTMLSKLHPEYVIKDGKEVSVLLSIEEFENILEDFQDLILVAERQDEPLTSHRDFVSELKLDNQNKRG